MKKLKDILKEAINPTMGAVYSNPYATAFTNENSAEVEFTSEQRDVFLAAVKEYKKFGESVYRTKGLEEVCKSIKNLVEVANKITIKETGDWFDGVTVSRHMKRMNESYKVFEKTLSEVATLQQRMESSYDEIGEVLSKYYEICNGEDDLEEGNEFGAARTTAIKNGDSEFEVDGKTYPVTDVSKDDKENAEEFKNESNKKGKSMKLTDLIKKSITEGKFKKDDLVYNKRTKTVGIVRIGDDKSGEVKTDADGNVDVDELEKYNPIKNKHQSNAKVAPSTEKEVSKRGLFNPFKNESVVNEDAKKVWKYKGVLLVDSDFVNLCKGKLPNSELKHAGGGNFFLQTPDGVISFDRTNGSLDGMGGRAHQVSDNQGGKLLAQLIKKMGAKIVNESVNEAKFKVLASFGGYDLIEAPTEKDMIISKNGKKVGKLTKISKYLKDDIKSFINMVKTGKLGESVNEARSKKVTKQMWDKMDDDTKIDALLSVVKDPDDAEKYFDKKWNELPSGFERDMTIDESVNENDPLEAFPQVYKDLLKKLQRSNDRGERFMLINKMNVIRKKLKLKPLTTESVVNEAKYDIGMARKGNGITVYNRAEEENGDYKNVAHISDNGVVKYYDKNLPSNIKKKIEAEASKMKESVNESKVSDAWKKNNKRGKILKVGNVTLKSDGPGGIHPISKNGKKWGTFELDGNDWMVKPTHGKENWVDSIDDVIKIVNESVNESKSMKLTSMLKESFGFGELPSSKLMKMKMTLAELMASESVVNEGYSSEEKKIVLSAVRRLMKYKSIDIETAARYIVGAAEELKTEIDKGQVKK
jgi:hypothetical protein